MLDLLIALYIAAVDLNRWIIGPPIILASVTVVMTGVSVLAARRLHAHPAPGIRWGSLVLAAALLLQLPARTADPSAFGRVIGTAALTWLLLAIAIRWRKGDPHD
ncbi:hypothetical protein GCM10008959_26350 [Deinococcus seoulensis]|uniref:DUF3054 domain-containing protein n=1 Tax=Deinococcus seoulensis TaxID=1837379 RepID=A0ABQ2RUD4_9DEIO|nr:hypothetical protein [Deinococcus seoulensis]GGR62989.1 hypothetical protein GCM10008959_26350 [Deinococcus seoulensis]